MEKEKEKVRDGDTYRQTDSVAEGCSQECLAFISVAGSLIEIYGIKLVISVLSY